MRLPFCLVVFLILFSCASTSQRIAAYKPSILQQEVSPLTIFPAPHLPLRTGQKPRTMPEEQNDLVSPTPPLIIQTIPAVQSVFSQVLPQKQAPVTPVMPLKPLSAPLLIPVFQNTPEQKQTIKPPANPSSAVKQEVKTDSKAPAPEGKQEKKVTPQANVPALKDMPAKPASLPASLPAASILPGATPLSSDFKFEEVNAKTGDDVYLQFSKLNWVYVDSRENQKQVGYLESRREKDGTSFLFRPKKAGQYELEFSRQDLTTGSSETKKIRLHVVEPEKKADPQTGSLYTDRSADQNRTSSNLLQKKGQTPEAVQKLLLNYNNDDTKTNLELGRLLSQSGQEEEALKYLDRNLGHQSNEFQESLSLATQTAIKKELRGKLPSYLQIWKDKKMIPPESVYLQSLEALCNSEMSSAAFDWADFYENWYPIPQKRDFFLYLKASLLEKPGSLRDVKQAWSLYDRIIQDYPLSPWWEKAGERASYINRHFLQVR